jgi:hypothetical protein
VGWCGPPFYRLREFSADRIGSPDRIPSSFLFFYYLFTNLFFWVVVDVVAGFLISSVSVAHLLDYVHFYINGKKRKFRGEKVQI